MLSTHRCEQKPPVKRTAWLNVQFSEFLRGAYEKEQKASLQFEKETNDPESIPAPRSDTFRRVGFAGESPPPFEGVCSGKKRFEEQPMDTMNRLGFKHPTSERQQGFLTARPELPRGGWTGPGIGGQMTLPSLSPRASFCGSRVEGSHVTRLKKVHSARESVNNRHPSRPHSSSNVGGKSGVSVPEKSVVSGRSFRSSRSKKSKKGSSAVTGPASSVSGLSSHTRSSHPQSHISNLSGRSSLLLEKIKVLESQLLDANKKNRALNSSMRVPVPP